MTFLWPFMLLSLLIVPVVIAGYLLLQKRRQALVDNFYRFSGSQPALHKTPGFRRHLPPLFSLLGLVILLVALARPQAQIRLPRIEGTVMLVFDVSASMGAADVEPSRLEAAKAAAREFVLSQPATIQIGVVAFSGSGFAVQAPTNDANALLGTIDRLKPASSTSLGQGILTALHTIAVDAGLMPETTLASPDPAAAPTPPGGSAPEAPWEEDLLAQLPEGLYPAAVIVLLSDGEDSSRSVDPLEAAKAAAEHGVRINALGFGTPAGITLEVDGFNVHTALNEATLVQITQAASGKYYPAQGSQDLEQVYASLTPELVVKPESMEITSVFAGSSILLLLAAGLLSLVWFNRLP